MSPFRKIHIIIPDEKSFHAEDLYESEWQGVRVCLRPEYISWATVVQTLTP